ncbi:Lacal_2735 family protein [Arenibacter sp. F20364]|uniref:Lacal_2735 family protein n=1 Tax=Arenibacter sp. F20364 TaxID=2926415 RepID=UPI001FF2B771|nr:Lacal_2735 family protein [Arenibacter sp. F20364]MCK0188417.1 Lacal_2735 family protein [Arenibacter sp. F20364]
MFGIFKKKSKVEKLQEKYNTLMKEWHTLSSINRSESDKKYAEAQEVLEELVALQKN